MKRLMTLMMLGAGLWMATGCDDVLEGLRLDVNVGGWGTPYYEDTYVVEEYWVEDTYYEEVWYEDAWSFLPW